MTYEFQQLAEQALNVTSELATAAQEYSPYAIPAIAAGAMVSAFAGYKLIKKCCGTSSFESGQQNKKKQKLT